MPSPLLHFSCSPLPSSYLSTGRGGLLDSGDMRGLTAVATEPACFRGRAMSAPAAREDAYGGGVEKGAPQQPGADEMVYTRDGVTISNAPVPAPYCQQPAGDNAGAPGAASARSVGVTASRDQFKRRRGHPRKYGPEALAVVPPMQAGSTCAVGSSGSAQDGSGAALTLPPGFCPAPAIEGGGGASHQAPPLPLPAASDAPFAGMGRPCSAKKLRPQRAATGGGGLAGLKPQIFTVKAGEDIASRAMSYSCSGWAVCILSANGAVSNVTLLQGDSSNGTVTYEGSFEILSLSGSYLLSDSSGLGSRTGGLSVSLAGPDGRVLGGSVAGPLIAASPVQVVIGRFLSDGKKEPDLNFSPGRLIYSAFAPSSSPSRGVLSESSGGHGNPRNTAGSFNTSNKPSFPNFPSWKMN